MGLRRGVNADGKAMYSTTIYVSEETKAELTELCYLLKTTRAALYAELVHTALLEIRSRMPQGTED